MTALVTKALVTGATGFVGAAVARRLLAEGIAVRALARRGSDRRNIAGLDVEVVEGDLTDAASVAAAARGCDSVFHVAADYRLWCPDPAPMMAANVEGTRTVVRAAAEAGAARIVYTSSVAVLRVSGDDTPSNEDSVATLADMIGPYKASKFLAEKAVDDLVRDEGAPVVIVNPSTPIGPGDVKPTPTGRLVLDAAAGRMPAYVDTGLNVVHVRDVAEGHWLAHQRGQVGRRYILGGEDMTLRRILETVARVAGRRRPSVRLPHAAVLPVAMVAEAVARITGREPIATVDGVRMARKRMYFSSARARDELGYAPGPAGDAIADAVEWFRANGYLAG